MRDLAALSRSGAGLETGDPLPARHAVRMTRNSEHPGQLGEEGAVVDEFVVELGGSLLVGEL